MDLKISNIYWKELVGREIILNASTCSQTDKGNVLQWNKVWEENGSESVMATEPMPVRPVRLDEAHCSAAP